MNFRLVSDHTIELDPPLPTIKESSSTTPITNTVIPVKEKGMIEISTSTICLKSRTEKGNRF
jgi:hypothetical protein